MDLQRFTEEQIGRFIVIRSCTDNAIENVSSTQTYKTNKGFSARAVFYSN